MLAREVPHTGPVNNAWNSCRPTTRTGCSLADTDRRATADASTVVSNKSRLLSSSSTSRLQRAFRLTLRRCTYHPHHIVTGPSSGTDLKVNVTAHPDPPDERPQSSQPKALGRSP
jgi:hypothetical protein